jgi:hypothetical protein
VIPAGVAILESKIKVKSNSIIPAFDGVAHSCDDEGKISIAEKYKTETTEGDFLLFMGVMNEPNDSTLAYATFCVVGKMDFFLNLFF